nr:unnamed protein product [Callosobruchus chinensis]
MHGHSIQEVRYTQQRFMPFGVPYSFLWDPHISAA